MTVAVLGAGPAGLAAAWRAARAGHRVVVLERAPVVGGMAASFTVAGVRVDHGSHRLHPSTDPGILAELQRLLGDSLQWRPRHGRIHLEGRWVRFPLRAGDLARRLPPSFAAAAARAAVLAPLRRPRADTFAEVVRAGLGPTMLDRFYGPYARKLWGLGADELSGEQARRRIAAASPLALAARLVPVGRDRRPPGFWYPAAGFGAIVDALAGAAVDAGVDLRLGAEVVGLEVGPGGATVALAGGSTVEARHVWSTLPLPALARVVDPPADAGVLAAARTLSFRSLVLVYLALDLDRWTPFDAHYLPGPTTPVTRVSEPKAYRDSRADPAGRTVLCAEVPCRAGDRWWSATDDELAGRVAADLTGLGLPPVRPVAVETRRVATAYPVYARGFEPAFAALDRWAAEQPGVVSLGRHGLYAHDNTHHALAMGWAAAAALRDDGSWDGARWAASRAGFRSHVVED